MNIFVIAWNTNTPDSRRIRAELRRMTDIYDSLDADTMWLQQSRSNAFVAASISSSADQVRPRRYVDRNDSKITLFSGLPVDPENEIAAHDARELGSHWARVQDRLEGTYGVIQLCELTRRLEIQTDIIGGEPIYYSRHDKGWLFSNSVLLIERLTGFRPLDELGVSMYLHLGYALGNRDTP